MIGRSRFAKQHFPLSVTKNMASDNSLEELDEWVLLLFICGKLSFYVQIVIIYSFFFFQITFYRILGFLTYQKVIYTTTFMSGVTQCLYTNENLLCRLQNINK